MSGGFAFRRPMAARFPELLPDDPHDRALADAVHPEDWVNPRPEGRYNLVVIGAGTAGLVAAAGAAGLGARVALIERNLMGGDCLNVGCVPSKALLAAARRAAAVRAAGDFGVRTGPVEVDFRAVMERMRRLRAGIAPHDSAHRFRELGVDVFLGEGVFRGPDTVEVKGQTLRFRKAVIATGARASAPDIPGLEGSGYLTHETLFRLDRLPPRLGVIGGGPIGCEMAQAFARFGSRVTLIESGSGLLSREEPDAAALVDTALRRDGVRVRCGCTALEVAGSSGSITLRTGGGEPGEDTVDHLLVAAGRVPNTDGLGLEQAGVRHGPAGVEVNDRLRTSNPRIFAAGDVCSRWRFTHAADFMARTVIANALFAGRRRASRLVVPWCTYTDPELARVGLSQAEAEAAGIAVDTFTQPLSGVDRAILEGAAEGFVRVHVRAGTDTIVGATAVGDAAGEWISELTVAMTRGIGLGALGNVIHPYPTRADAVRRLGDLYSRTRLTPRVAGALRRYLRWARRG